MKRLALSPSAGFYASLIAAALMAACATPQPEPTTAPPVAMPSPPPAQQPVPPAPPQPQPPTTPPVTLPTQPVPLGQLRPVDWSAISNWRNDSLSESWPAFLQTCAGLKSQPSWQTVCSEAQNLDGSDESALRAFFEQHFQPHEVFNPDNTLDGTVTGYYEPLIKGDRDHTRKARFPLYAAPDDLITVDLSSVYPELKSLRLRGRLQGNKVVPYLTRNEIEDPSSSFKGKPIAWAEDAVDLFFLQIQGSGRIELPDGSHMRVGYADQNGYPYRSIGKLLVERGELKLEEASMQGIKAWALANPEKLPELLSNNASYVFFKELPNGLSGPLGALGVPLTAGRSIAIDPKYIPLGAPVFLSTTWPNSSQPLNRLMMAQDTGGAIRGAVRADFYWGFGADAGEQAGKMKQKGRMWVLLPRDYPILQSANSKSR
jgi:membrane-bound lytic murein transglycosylase A